MNKQYENNEDVIDLMEVLLALKKRIWIIILALLIGGIGGGLYSSFLITPRYVSTSMMYVLTKETTLSSLADLQIGSQLTNDYRLIVTSRPVLEEVIEKQGLNMEYEDLYSMISINNPKDTRVLTISVNDTSPERARDIVNEITKTAAEYIGDIMDMIPPRTVEQGVLPQAPVSPNLSKNIKLGALLGAALVCGLIVLGVILNDTIRSEEDITRYLQIPVLACVPEKMDPKSQTAKKQKRRNDRKARR